MTADEARKTTEEALKTAELKLEEVLKQVQDAAVTGANQVAVSAKRVSDATKAELSKLGYQLQKGLNDLTVSW